MTEHEENLHRNERRPAEQHAQNLGQIGAAPQDRPAASDDAVEAKLAAQLWSFLDPVDRGFGGAVKNRKHRLLAAVIDGVVAPLARGNHAAIKSEYCSEFAPVERNRCG